MKNKLRGSSFSSKKLEPRNQEEFEAAHLEIEELKKQHKNGVFRKSFCCAKTFAENIELWSFDESGFDLQPSVPYAWQPVGQTIEVPSKKSKRLNILGFLTPSNDLEAFCFEGTVNTDVVVACFDQFAARKTLKTRIVLIDNASIHTNAEFVIHLEKWEKKGVIVRSLPTYCSELNPIEILWRFIKYYWLPFSAYLSFDNLKKELENILKKIGSDFIINFAY